MNQGINKEQLLDYVIAPVCRQFGGGKAAEELLLGTAIQESHCGHYIHQLGDGPALGIFQMEPATHDDIWENYIEWRRPLRSVILQRIGITKQPTPKRMITDLFYAAVMCRIHYLRVKENLPAAGELQAQADYWKVFYNTINGRGTAEEYKANWAKFHDM